MTLDEALRVLVPGLLSLLEAPIDDAAWDALDPARRRRRTVDGVRQMLIRESQVQPVCVVFEDLHWVDAESQGLLDALVESLPTARLLLLVNYRPEYSHRWVGKTYYSQLRLDPLPPESSEELLRALVGEHEELDPIKQMLAERAEGTPFFLEECVRTLVETGALTGERGAYRLAKAFNTIQVPATVQAILAARIDRLPPEDKTLLQTAAVIGKDVPFALLQALAELSDDALRHGLGRLQASEFLYETALFPELEYTFKHALTQEVAYGGLLQERRRALHAAIVRAFEGLYPENPGSRAPHRSGRAWPFVASTLGAAWLGLGHVDEALPLLEQAVDRATAMKLMANQPLRLVRLAEAHVMAGRPDSASLLAVKAIDLAQEQRERGHEAYALKLLGDVWAIRDDPDEDRAEEHYPKALALAVTARHASTSGTLPSRPRSARLPQA